MPETNSDVIHLPNGDQIFFIELPDGWYWTLMRPTDGHPAYPKPRGFDGPHSSLKAARIVAWREVIEGKAKITYIQVVGYAWSKLLERRNSNERRTS